MSTSNSKIIPSESPKLKCPRLSPISLGKPLDLCNTTPCCYNGVLVNKTHQSFGKQLSKTETTENESNIIFSESQDNRHHNNFGESQGNRHHTSHDSGPYKISNIKTKTLGVDFSPNDIREDLEMEELTKQVAQARILEKKADLRRELNSIYNRLNEGQYKHLNETETNNKLYTNSNVKNNNNPHDIHINSRQEPLKFTLNKKDIGGCENQQAKRGHIQQNVIKGLKYFGKRGKQHIAEHRKQVARAKLRADTRARNTRARIKRQLIEELRCIENRMKCIIPSPRNVNHASNSTRNLFIEPLITTSPAAPTLPTNSTTIQR